MKKLIKFSSDIKYYFTLKKQADLYWRSLKDKHKGEAGFVIGNGPSLTMDDLSRIHEKGFVSIASNKVYLAFDQVDWRPTYFTVADKIVWSKISELFADYLPEVIVPKSFKTKTKKGKVRPYLRKETVLKDLKKRRQKYYFSNDYAEGVYGGGTVTFENIQLAVHLGLNPIYIIGCDHTYAGRGEGKTIDRSSEIKHDKGVENHFIKGYRKEGEIVYSANIILMEAAYMEARRYCDAHGIKIFNATRNGELEIFNRKNLTNILK